LGYTVELQPQSSGPDACLGFSARLLCQLREDQLFLDQTVLIWALFVSS
jgi:hypothetical protein